MLIDVNSFIRNCPYCQVNKVPSQGGEGPLKNIAARAPFACFSIDTVGPLTADAVGLTYIFVCIDDFSRFVWTVPIKSTSSEDAIKAMNKIFATTRRPQAIRHDAGTQFASEAFNDFLKSLKIQNLQTTPANHQGNGIVERCIRSYMDEMRKRIQELHIAREWPLLLDVVTDIYNHTIHTAIGHAPCDLIFPPPELVIRELQRQLAAREQNEEEDEQDPFLHSLEASAALLVTNVLSAQDNQEDTLKKRRVQHDKKNIKPTVFERNDYVLLIRENKPSKFAPRRTGPWRITEVLPNSCYTICDVRAVARTKTVHVRQLVAFDASRCSLSQMKNLMAILDDCYAVEEVLEHKDGRRGRDYLIKFEGFDKPEWINSKTIAKKHPALLSYLDSVKKNSKSKRK